MLEKMIDMKVEEEEFEPCILEELEELHEEQTTLQVTAKSKSKLKLKNQKVNIKIEKLKTKKLDK